MLKQHSWDQVGVTGSDWDQHGSPLEPTPPSTKRRIQNGSAEILPPSHHLGWGLFAATLSLPIARLSAGEGLILGSVHPGVRKTKRKLLVVA